MPYCPKCKNEYTNSVSVCADCNEPLVDSLDDLQEDSDTIVILYGEAEDLEEITRFLQYAEIESCALVVKEDYNKSYITIHKKEEDKTRKLIALYRKNKQEELDKTPPVDEETEKSEISDLFSETKVYENKTEKLNNLKSSAYTLLLVGIAGVIVVALAFAGILDFNLSSQMKYIAYAIMGALFLIFIFFGIRALQDSKKVKQEAVTENDLTANIKNWFHENFNLESDDLLLPDDMEEEIKYYKRIEYMKRLIKENFPSAEEALMDTIADDLYQEFYEA